MVKYAVWVSSSIEGYEGLCYGYDGRNIFHCNTIAEAEEYKKQMCEWNRDTKYTVVKVESV